MFFNFLDQKSTFCKIWKRPLWCMCQNSFSNKKISILEIMYLGFSEDWTNQIKNYLVLTCVRNGGGIMYWRWLSVWSEKFTCQRQIFAYLWSCDIPLCWDVAAPSRRSTSQCTVPDFSLHARADFRVCRLPIGTDWTSASWRPALTTPPTATSGSSRRVWSCSRPRKHKTSMTLEGFEAVNSTGKEQ